MNPVISVILSTTIACGSIGCVANQPKELPPQVVKFEQIGEPISDAALVAIQDQIRSRMIDPDSTKFSKVVAADVHFDNGVQQVSVCGSYNSKNRYGGYAGAKLFYYVDDLGLFLQDESAPISQRQRFLLGAKQYCQGKNL